MRTHIAIIGAGPAGVTAAQAAADAGARVTLIAAEPAGGRSVWSSLLPSKVLLTAADSLGAMKRAPALGLNEVTGGAPNIEALTRRIHALSQSQSQTQASHLNRREVQFLGGTAAFSGEHRLRITPAEGSPADLEADAIVVATGSVPLFPPHLKPDGKRIIAPRFVSQMRSLPSSLIIVGGGITGTEFVYAFNRLGVAVTWLVDEFGVLPPFEREVVSALVKALEHRGVARHEGVAADSAVADGNGVMVTLRDGRSFKAEMAFIAIGRQPDVAELNLNAAGLTVDPRRGIAVDGTMRSAAPHIYAAGDATGMPMTANKAMAQGWIAGRHAAGASADPYRSGTLVEAVYTDPQVAQVGLTEKRAQERGRPVRVLRLGYEALLKAALLDETEGFVQLVADAEDGTLLGASAIGAHASNVLTPLALGIRLGIRLDNLAALFPAHPGLSELAFAAARMVANGESVR
jgi:dihydrolipoamide dehydrogenase